MLTEYGRKILAPVLLIFRWPVFHLNYAKGATYPQCGLLMLMRNGSIRSLNWSLKTTLKKNRPKSKTKVPERHLCFSRVTCASFLGQKSLSPGLFDLNLVSAHNRSSTAYPSNHLPRSGGRGFRHTPAFYP